MSEHEGFGVPLLEAMAAEVPVLAYAAGAVPETLGGAGIAFTEKRFAALAELVAQVMGDEALREKMLKGQQRVGELSDEAAGEAASAQRRCGSACASAARGRGRRIQRGTASRCADPSLGCCARAEGRTDGSTPPRRRHHRPALRRRRRRRRGPRAPGRPAALAALGRHRPHHLRQGPPHLGERVPRGRRAGRAGPGAALPRDAAARDARLQPALAAPSSGAATTGCAEEHWVAEQGPLCPGLMRHLERERRAYDGFVFFTYLYAPTALGLPLVADRAMVVPTAHDEPPFAFDVYARRLRASRGRSSATRPEERDLIAAPLPEVTRRPGWWAWASRPRAASAGAVPEAPRRRGGRTCSTWGGVEEGKGVGELLALHRALRARDARGSGAGPRRRTPACASRRAASATSAASTSRTSTTGWPARWRWWCPSRFESLSLLALEAFAQGTPVLGNGASEVVAGQLRRSGAGGRTTTSTPSSRAAQLERRARRRWARRRRAFAKKHSWAKVVAAYRAEMQRIMEAPR